MTMQHLRLVDNEAALYCTFDDRYAAKTITGYKFHRASKTWRYPISPTLVEEAAKAFPDCRIDENVVIACEAHKARKARIAELKAVGWKDQVFTVDMPVRAVPYQHQKAAYVIALEQFGWA
jgi:hypothetical protein